MLQTPQAFRYAELVAAHERAAAEGRDDFTDDGALFAWAGHEVAMFDGEARNLKLTTPDQFDDALLRRAGAAFLAQGDVRTGSGFDVHAFGPGDHVMLGGVRVPHDFGLVGHSRRAVFRGGGRLDADRQQNGRQSAMQDAAHAWSDATGRRGWQDRHSADHADFFAMASRDRARDGTARSWEMRNGSNPAAGAIGRGRSQGLPEVRARLIYTPGRGMRRRRLRASLARGAEHR
ncbi:2-C-methyl-D-erythritol 2,4-cyclodiphosphate synthase [Hansschlegelia beijingensis]|uniref:2-C-methyl-D-erythritol 2,4-cyclodiphosphate synthase n=1 Tax=Hansschlegelia beijingensis TaxID=1133344 RepID=UPI00387F078C